MTTAQRDDERQAERGYHAGAARSTHDAHRHPLAGKGYWERNQDYAAQDNDYWAREDGRTNPRPCGPTQEEMERGLPPDLSERYGSREYAVIAAFVLAFVVAAIVVMLIV